VRTVSGIVASRIVIGFGNSGIAFGSPWIVPVILPDCAGGICVN